MELHTIGYVLDNLSLEGVAYCYRGACEGMAVFHDSFDDNRLKILYPDGEILNRFYFKNDQSLSPEEKKQWLIFSEIEDIDLKTSIINKLSAAFTESIKRGYELKVSE